MHYISESLHENANTKCKFTGPTEFITMQTVFRRREVVAEYDGRCVSAQTRRWGRWTLWGGWTCCNLHGAISYVTRLRTQPLLRHQRAVACSHCNMQSISNNLDLIFMLVIFSNLLVMRLRFFYQHYRLSEPCAHIVWSQSTDTPKFGKWVLDNPNFDNVVWQLQVTWCLLSSIAF